MFGRRSPFSGKVEVRRNIPGGAPPGCNLMTGRGVASATGCRISPARFTHPSRIARPISKPASRSRIAAYKYAGVWSKYLHTTVAMTTVLKCVGFCIINTLTRGSRAHL